MDKAILAGRAVSVLKDNYKSCTLCGHQCGVDRASGQEGFCGAGVKTRVHGVLLHPGEEPCLSGVNGSGTIFFAGCSLRCLYCQNYEFSQDPAAGEEISSSDLASEMISLQQRGAHNINLVTPTHYLPGIVEALKIAYEHGLEIPVVYNTSGYDAPYWIKTLEGVVDIFLPDMRYSNNEIAKEYSKAAKYVDHNRRSVMAMAKIAGSLVLRDGIARKGLLIRLLLLPGDLSGTVASLKFIRKFLGRRTYLSIMTQYRPFYKALGSGVLNRDLEREEYDRIVASMEELGLDKGWIQPPQHDFDPGFYGKNLFS